MAEKDKDKDDEKLEEIDGQVSDILARLELLKNAVRLNPQFFVASDEFTAQDLATVLLKLREISIDFDELFGNVEVCELCGTHRFKCGH